MCPVAHLPSPTRNSPSVCSLEQDNLIPEPRDSFEGYFRNDMQGPARLWLTSLRVLPSRNTSLYFPPSIRINDFQGHITVWPLPCSCHISGLVRHLLPTRCRGCLSQNRNGLQGIIIATARSKKNGSNKSPKPPPLLLTRHQAMRYPSSSWHCLHKHRHHNNRWGNRCQVHLWLLVSGNHGSRNLRAL